MSSPTNTHLSPSAASSPPTELRHITSTGALTPQKDIPIREQKLSGRSSHNPHRLGSRSPNSIPSSPTSVHSSSSAIFERDIEPIAPSPPQPSHPSHPHRTPRGKATEQLDHAVPSVLDSAAAVLASPTDDQTIAVVAPATEHNSRSGFASPISRMSSRSPSPVAGRTGVTLMNLPSPAPSLSLPLPNAPASPTQSTQRPTLHTFPTTSSGPQVPGAYSFTSTSPTPTTATVEQLPDVLTTSLTEGSLQSSSSANQLSPSTLSHPPSPRVATKRLSFMSYTDLLSSTPSSTLPLSSLTTSATAADPPPHIPSVLGVPQHSGGGSTGASPRSSFYGDRDVREGREGMLLDDVGGEWEREGLGQGLEERLETLMGVNNVTQVGVGKA